MYKSSFYSLLIVLAIPLLSYIWLYASTYQKIQMPPKHFVDTILTKTEKGKIIYDTLFHKVKKDLAVINYTNNKSITLGNMWDHQVTLLYIANGEDSFTYKYLKKLSRLKRQLKIDSFVNIICFVNISFPDSLLVSGIEFIMAKDTLQQKLFFNNELKMNIFTSLLPFVVLVDKQNFVRNYYLLNNLDEERFLLDIILLNLEKEI